MNYRLPSFVSRRFWHLAFLLTLSACLSSFVPAQEAQSAHFGGAVQIPGSSADESSRSAAAAQIGLSGAPDIQTTHGDFGPVNVGSSSAKAIAMVFTFDTDVTLGSVAVVTQGAKELDFTNPGGGTCKPATAFKAGDTCTVRVTFKPRFSGVRYGAAELLDSAGNLLATGYVQGIGVGPQVTFANTTSGACVPSTQSMVYWDFNGVNFVAVDGNGNVFFLELQTGTLKEMVAVNGRIPASPTIKSLPGRAYDSVAVDGAGNLFTFSGDPNGEGVTEYLAASGYTTTRNLGTGLYFPMAVAVDGSGNLFVVDNYYTALKEIVAAGGYSTVKTVNSAFSSYYGLAVDGSGNLFSQTGNNVTEFLAASDYTTFKTLGVGLWGIATDAHGNLFGFNGSYVNEVLASSGYTKVLSCGPIGSPQSVAVGPSGNVFAVGGRNNGVVEMDFADPPVVSFAPTGVGAQSGDSPQIVTVSNTGNAPLTFPIPGAGDSPTLEGDGFKLDAATTCPQLSGGSTAGTLAAGSSCNYAVDFIPVELDTNSGSLALTDNSLNANPAVTQTISLTGQGFGPATQLVYTWAPDALKLSSARPGIVKVAIEDAGGRLVTTPRATVTLTVTGPNSYSRQYTAGAVGGVATFRNLDYLSAGAYTYTATDAPDGVAPAVANQTVWSYHLAFTVPPAAWLAPGQTPGTVKVSPKNFLNRTIRWNYCIIQLAVTGPNGYSQVYTTALSSGTATFSTLPALTTKGNYTYTASNTDCGATPAVANELVNMPPPFGALDLVVDNTTFSTTVGQSDSFRVRGWVADLKDGAPLSNVTAYVDGTSIGAPTLGLPSPAIATQYGNAYLNSGYQLVYPATSFSLGKHKVTVVAIDSGGRSTTLGPRTFTVATTAGPGAPFGAIGAAVDSVTGSTTVSQTHSLKVWGWVADQTDGAPLANVKVYVDGVSIGTPTLGLPRPTVAATYGSRYLNSGLKLLYPASSLSIGTHEVTVVATDSGGRTTTIGPHIITVQ